MKSPMYEPCPVCNSTWNIKTALTVHGARRKWNRYVRKWTAGYEAVKPVILADLDKKLEEMKNDEKDN